MEAIEIDAGNGCQTERHRHRKSLLTGSSLSVVVELETIGVGTCSVWLSTRKECATLRHTHTRTERARTI